MTRDEAEAQLLLVLPDATPSDVASFLAGTDDDRALVIHGMKDSGKMPSASAWDRVLVILGACAALASLVIPITGAIQGVYGLRSL